MGLRHKQWSGRVVVRAGGGSGQGGVSKGGSMGASVRGVGLRSIAGFISPIRESVGVGWHGAGA